MTPTLNQILEEYGLPENCKVSDPAKVERILQTIIKDGSDKLQVIMDFDYTMTPFLKDGIRCPSTWCIVNNSPLMSAAYREAIKNLVDNYRSFEIDHEISNEEKIPRTITFCKAGINLLMEHGISKGNIKEMVETSNAHLRESAHKALSFLNDHKVPCLVFSAGLGDILEEVLYQEKGFFPNVKVASNYICFNEDGQGTCFKEPFIHMFNKNQSALDNPIYFKELSHRNNGLVVGDSLGDVDMDKGICNPGAILKIGILNEKNERLETYMMSFDVVLMDDQTFKFVDVVLKNIISPS